MTETWEPNQELLQTLTSMGISNDIGTEALFCTGNESIDDAINYIFSQDDLATVQGKSSNEHYEGEASEGESTEDDKDDPPYFKMTFVVNGSLKMGVGKIAAQWSFQVGHACLGLYRELLQLNKEAELMNWEYAGEKKIVLKGNTTEHLQELFEKAKAQSMPCYLVRDAGHTQIAPGSVTVLSLFGLENDVNTITGKLGLL